MNDVEKWKIYDRRAIISYDVGSICRFDCLYCYNKESISIPQITELEETIKELSEITDVFEIITPGCEQELFCNSKKAIEFMKKTSKLDKIISFATKIVLSKKVVTQIKKIDNFLYSKILLNTWFQ